MIFQNKEPATALNIHSTFYKIAFASLLVASASALVSTYFGMFAWNTDPRTELYKMVYGLADKPFVTRVLVPLLIRGVAAILPLSLDWIANVVMWLALLAYIAGMFHLVSALWRRSILTDVLVWGALISLYPLMFSLGRHIYDFATLCLFTWALATLAHKQWRAYLIVFLLSCINRETTALLIGVYIFHAYKLTTRSGLIKWSVFQIASYLLVRATIIWIFWDNPGTLTESRPLLQIDALILRPYLSTIFIVAGVGIATLILFRWKLKSLFLRKAVIVILPALLISYLVFGNPFEIRVFYEAQPAAYLLSVLSLCHLSKLQLEPADSIVV